MDVRESNERANSCACNFCGPLNLSLIAQREDLATGLCDVTTITWQGKFFFLNDTATLDSLHRNIYVQMLAPKEECKKYTVTVSLEDKMGVHFLRCSDHPLLLGVFYVQSLQ